MSGSAEFDLLESLVKEIRATDSKHDARYERISGQLEQVMTLVVESSRERDRREAALEESQDRHAQRITQLENVATGILQRMAPAIPG